MNRKEIYRKILKAKGRYTFIGGMDIDYGISFHIDEKHVFRKIIDSIIKGHIVILHFVFPFDLKRGYEVYPFVKEKVFTWNNSNLDLTDEFYICEGVEYSSMYDFDYGEPREWWR